MPVKIVGIPTFNALHVPVEFDLKRTAKVIDILVYKSLLISLSEV